VVWAAALALSAARARAACLALADVLVSAAQRAASSRGVQRAAALMRQVLMALHDFFDGSLVRWFAASLLSCMWLTW
jgi:hypothetical protein